MLRTNKSINVTGQSIITDADNATHVVVYMTSSVTEGNGNPNVSKTIQDKELYLANIETCRNDMSEFDDMIDKLIGGSTNEK